MRITEPATLAPARESLSGLAEGAMRWLGRNLAFFDPFSASSPLPDNRKAKAVLELALFCRSWSNLRPATELLHRATALLRTIWLRSDFPHLIDTHGGPWAGTQRLAYAALAPAGVREDLRAAALARLEADGFLSPREKTPYRRLETRYYADLAGVAHDLESYRALADRSLLTNPPAPPVSMPDAYTFTHTAFYLGDYGSRDLGLPEEVRRRARQAAAGMLETFAGEDQWDLTGELLITLACLGGDPAATPSGRAGIRCLAEIQRADGAIPGRSAASRVPPFLPPGAFFRRAYHTTLVVALMSLIVG